MVSQMATIWFFSPPTNLKEFGTRALVRTGVVTGIYLSVLQSVASVKKNNQFWIH